MSKEVCKEGMGLYSRSWERPRHISVHGWVEPSRRDCGLQVAVRPVGSGTLWCSFLIQILDFTNPPHSLVVLGTCEFPVPVDKWVGLGWPGSQPVGPDTSTLCRVD